ncbi:hypothetical protein ACIBAI_22180 [Streptomyces sp. NPDC051041]|uniref:hypothetical protein n=1 Tax=Streptomyces sp. NPDC051041 TaxID=3365640 RepID=UPI0037A8D815
MSVESTRVNSIEPLLRIAALEAGALVAPLPCEEAPLNRAASGSPSAADLPLGGHSRILDGPPCRGDWPW